MAGVDPELLRDAGVFSTLSERQRARLAGSARLTEHPAGAELTHEGAIQHRFHLIVDGRALIEQRGAIVAEVGPGDFVGEVALLGGGRATATVQCSAPTRCLTLEREAFWETLDAEPAIALRILEVVCRRLEQMAGATTSANLPGGWTAPSGT